MTAPRTRSAAVTAYCKGCIHDSAAFGTWREQVAACPAVDCPLWRFRPLQDSASCPDWIKSRNPADLPEGWARIHQADAVRMMRRWIADKAHGLPVQHGGETRTHGSMVLPTPAPAMPETRADALP